MFLTNLVIFDIINAKKMQVERMLIVEKREAVAICNCHGYAVDANYPPGNASVCK